MVAPYLYPYRYGFNGKENDPETVGTGQGTQDYGMRIYNPALGRFLSVDPLFKHFAWNSTYAFAENDVMRSIDLDGTEKFVTNDGKYIGLIGGSTQVRSVDAKDIKTVTFWINAANNPPKNSDDQFVSRATDRAKQFSSLKKWETFKRWDASLEGGNDGANIGRITKTDLKVASVGSNVVGKTLKYAGYVAAVTPAAELSPLLIESGEAFEGISDAIDYSIEYQEKGLKSVVKSVVVDKVADFGTKKINKTIDASDLSKNAKNAVKAYNVVKKDVVTETVKGN